MKRSFPSQFTALLVAVPAFFLRPVLWMPFTDLADGVPSIYPALLAFAEAFAFGMGIALIVRVLVGRKLARTHVAVTAAALLLWWPLGGFVELLRTNQASTMELFLRFLAVVIIMCIADRTWGKRSTQA